MDFAQAWEELAIGDVVTVSNGRPCPSTNRGGLPYRLWRSHNFTGVLVEMSEGEAGRTMRFELAADASGSVVGYSVAEGGGHGFVRE
jgi:hypothetical protein